MSREDRKNIDDVKEILEKREMVLDARSQNKTQHIR